MVTELSFGMWNESKWKIARIDEKTIKRKRKIKEKRTPLLQFSRICAMCIIYIILFMWLGLIQWLFVHLKVHFLVKYIG